MTSTQSSQRKNTFIRLAKAVLHAGAKWIMKPEPPQRRNIPLRPTDSKSKVGQSAYVRIAEPSDDDGIRLLLRQRLTPSPIHLTYLREPSFLDSLSVEGRFNQVIIGIDNSTNQVFELGCRSIKTAFINGQATSLGHLSTLYVAPPYRGGNYLARGYRLLRELHEDGRTKLYLQTIVEGNERARLLLTSGRAGLPTLHDFGRYDCLAISLKQKVKDSPVCLTIRSARAEDIPDIIEFWHREGSRKQFFPEYSADDLLSANGLLRGLHPENILLAHVGGEVVGTAAAWDQSASRQVMVSGYSRRIALLRPLYNMVAQFLGYPVFLPRVGSYISNYFNLSLVCVKDNNPQVFMALLAELMKRYKSGYDFFMAGFHESDTLLPVLKQYRYFAYPQRLFIAHYEDGEQDYNSLDGGVPYLELGAL
jgi:hypothetical protein